MLLKRSQEVQRALGEIGDSATAEEIRRVLKSRLKSERTISISSLRLVSNPIEEAEQHAKLAELPREQRNLLAMVEAGFAPWEIGKEFCCNETQATHGVRRAASHLARHI